MINNFVVSSRGFGTKKEAEDKVSGWLMGGQFDQKCRLFKVVKEYIPKIKFVEKK